MRERWKEPLVRLRRGDVGDSGFVRIVAEQVFAELGDYGRILPTWLIHDGVLTHVAEVGGRPIGYTMIGFYPAIAPKLREYVADLLAIAVAPGAQGRGVGKRLLENAIAQARAAKRRMAVTEMRLSVAEPNRRARSLFETYGFRYVEGEHGMYDGGQRALHMTRPLDD